MGYLRFLLFFDTLYISATLLQVMAGLLMGVWRGVIVPTVWCIHNNSLSVFQQHDHRRRKLIKTILYNNKSEYKTCCQIFSHERLLEWSMWYHKSTGNTICQTINNRNVPDTVTVYQHSKEINAASDYTNLSRVDFSHITYIYVKP